MPWSGRLNTSDVLSLKLVAIKAVGSSNCLATARGTVTESVVPGMDTTLSLGLSFESAMPDALPHWARVVMPDAMPNAMPGADDMLPPQAGVEHTNVRLSSA